MSTTTDGGIAHVLFVATAEGGWASAGASPLVLHTPLGEGDTFQLPDGTTQVVQRVAGPQGSSVRTVFCSAPAS